MKATIINSLLLAILIYFHETLFEFALNLKLSFTLSMIIPYALEFAAVCALLFSINKNFLKEKNYNVRRMVSLLVLVGGCGIAFAVHPIYDGDFNHTYQEVYFSGNNEDVFQPGLNMVVLPGCPYCYATLDKINKIKKLYPNLKAHLLIVNQDSLAYEDYKESATEGITLGFLPEEVASILKINQFPTLFYKSDKNAKNLIQWTNDGFGSSAWDFVLDNEK